MEQICLVLPLQPGRGDDAREFMRELEAIAQSRQGRGFTLGGGGLREPVAVLVTATQYGLERRLVVPAQSERRPSRPSSGGPVILPTRSPTWRVRYPRASAWRRHAAQLPTAGPVRQVDTEIGPRSFRLRGP